jgi:hypothetical protein
MNICAAFATPLRRNADDMLTHGREIDGLGVVDVPADELWGAQTQRPLEHFSSARNLISPEMIAACTTLKKDAAPGNRASKRLNDQSVSSRSSVRTPGSNPELGRAKARAKCPADWRNP